MRNFRQIYIYSNGHVTNEVKNILSVVSSILQLVTQPSYRHSIVMLSYHMGREDDAFGGGGGGGGGGNHPIKF